jgi:hypothetical protein
MFELERAAMELTVQMARQGQTAVMVQMAKKGQARAWRLLRLGRPVESIRTARLQMEEMAVMRTGLLRVELVRQRMGNQHRAQTVGMPESTAS